MRASAGALRALPGQLQCFSTSAAAQALPALTEAPAATTSFFTRLFKAGAPRGVPLTDPFPNVDLPAPFTAPSSPPATETTMLSNGVTVASEATLGPTATLGIYVNSGSVYETAQNTGISHLLEYMAFKSTANRTHFRLVREVEGIGGNVLASASREQMAYNFDVVKSNVPEALEILTDAVLNPKFTAWEVKAALEKVKEDLKGIKDNPQTVLLEGIHEVAYTGALSRPLLAAESALGQLSSEALAEFVAANYTAPRLVLAGAGVEHGELVGLARPLLEGLPAVPAPAPPASKYVGGDFRQYSAAGLTHLMLGFEFAGGWRDVKGSVAVTVLQFLLGGGGSFSAGGPGKGMHSRLYTRVLNQYPWMHNCTAFNSLYNDTGIVGVFASAESARAEDACNVLCKELQAVAKDVPTGELERAKAAAISSVLMNLESKAVVAEDLGRQVLTYGHRKPVNEFVSEIRKLTPGDITKVVGKMLKSPVTIATIGDIADIPRYDALSSRFK